MCVYACIVFTHLLFQYCMAVMSMQSGVLSVDSLLRALNLARDPSGEQICDLLVLVGQKKQSPVSVLSYCWTYSHDIQHASGCC